MIYILQDYHVPGETLGENEAFALISTGEVRFPLKGEWYSYAGGKPEEANRDYSTLQCAILELCVIKHEVVRPVKDPTEYPINRHTVIPGLILNELGIRGVKTGEVRPPKSNEFCIKNGRVQSTVWSDDSPVAIAKLVRSQ